MTETETVSFIVQLVAIAAMCGVFFAYMVAFFGD